MAPRKSAWPTFPTLAAGLFIAALVIYREPLTALATRFAEPGPKARSAPPAPPPPVAGFVYDASHQVTPTIALGSRADFEKYLAAVLGRDEFAFEAMRERFVSIPPNSEVLIFERRSNLEAARIRLVSGPNSGRDLYVLGATLHPKPL